MLVKYLTQFKPKISNSILCYTLKPYYICLIDYIEKLYTLNLVCQILVIPRCSQLIILNTEKENGFAFDYKNNLQNINNISINIQTTIKYFFKIV